MVKLNVKLLKDKVEFQSIYEAYIDFNATYKELGKLGYCPKRYSAGRPRKDGLQQQDAGNLVFTLNSGAKVNVSPKGFPYKIQVTWNNHGDKDKQFRELKNVLVPSEDGLMKLIPYFSVSLSYTDDREEFLNKLFSE